MREILYFPNECWKLLGKCLVPFKDCLYVDLLWLVLPIACYLLLVRIFRDQISKSKAATGKRLWQILTSNWQMMFFAFLLSLLAMCAASSYILDSTEWSCTNNLEKYASLDKGKKVTYSYAIRRHIYSFSQNGLRRHEKEFRHFYDLKDQRQLNAIQPFVQYNSQNAENPQSNNSSRKIVVDGLIKITKRNENIDSKDRARYKSYYILYDVLYKWCHVTHSAVWVLIWTIIACWWFMPDMSSRPPRRR